MKELAAQTRNASYLFALFFFAASAPKLAADSQISSSSLDAESTSASRQDALLTGVNTATLLRPNGTRRSFPAHADTNAARGFALLAARTAAVSGDTIVVGPGTYRVDANLAKNGVNWHFVIGASVRRIDHSDEALWDDRNTKMVFSVTGNGDFLRVNTAGLIQSLVIRIRNPESHISIQGRDFTAQGSPSGKAEASVLRLENGQVTLEGRFLTATGNRQGYVLWWFNGTGTVRAMRITGDYVSVGSTVTDYPTGDFHVTAEQIETAILSSGTQATSAMWISCQTLKDVLPDGGAVSITGLGRTYITAQKIFGTIYTSGFGGLLYVRADKQSATIAGANGYCSFLNVDGGDVFYNVEHFDPNGFGGDSVLVTGGNLNWNQGSLTGIGSTNGILIAGGTTRLSNIVLNTEANRDASPITKSGGILILNNSTLVCNNQSLSISAPNEQSVSVYGTSVANAAASPNISIQVGTLMIDSKVQ